MVRGGRTLTVLVSFGLAYFGAAPKASATDLGPVRSLSAHEDSLLRAINRARVAHGVPRLRVGARLQRAAEAHSRRMARTGTFEHGNWYRRLRRAGVRARTLGETIAWGAGDAATADGIVSMWLASPAHRATMLWRGFRQVGVGVAVGAIDGASGRIATADFAG